MCILCGCDYCDTIRGIGQMKAYQFIQKYKTIEKVIENLPEKYQVNTEKRMNRRYLQTGPMQRLGSSSNNH